MTRSSVEGSGAAVAGGAVAMRGRRRAIAGMLLLLALWPPIHYSLVVRHQTNAWKLFGWAMYTRPRYVPTVEVYSLGGPANEGRRVRLALLGPEWADAERARRSFIEWTEAFGTLVQPRALAREVRRVVPPGTTVEIVVLRFGIDAGTDRVMVDRDSYFYEASPPSGVAGVQP